MTDQPEPPNDPKVDHLVELYIQCRDWVKAEKKKHELHVAKKKVAMAKIEGTLQTLLDKTGQIRGACKTGTFYTTTKYSASIADKEAFKRHVIGTESWDLLDLKANVIAIQDFAKTDSPEAIGVKLTAIAKIGVRRPGADDGDDE